MPIVAALVTLLGLETILEKTLHRTIMNDRAMSNTQGVQQGFDQLLHDSARSLTGLIRLIDTTPELQQSWLAGDKTLLLQAAAPIYHSIHNDFNVTHFYFHDLQGINILRVHNPSISGDRITRTSFKQAVETSKMGVGLEIGLFGNLVLRVVHPWKINNRLAGYIEIGQDMDRITRQLSRTAGLNIATLLKKNRLDSNSPNLNKASRLAWHQFSDYVLINRSSDSALLSDINDDVISELLNKDHSVRLSNNDRSYIATQFPLFDVNKSNIGFLLLIADISDEVSTDRILLFSKLASGLIVGILLFVVSYIYIGGIQTRLNNAHNDLVNQIEIQQETADQLRIKTEELTARNQELESYSRSIAHDLRTPLRSIVGFSQIVLEDNNERLTDDSVNHLNQIVSSGKQMSQIIDEILELSRISRSDLRYEDLNFSVIAEDIIKKLTRGHHSPQLRLTVQKDISVKADKKLLQVMLHHLLDNALKYTAQEPVPVIEVGKTLYHNQPCLFIRDNGIGFDMQYAGQIFSAFHRLHNDQQNGTGIGLAIVQRILQRHNQRIWVESVENEGSTFYFTLQMA